MDTIELKVTKREVLGKKVKHLRRQGITPVHLFGHGIESLALQCNTGELERVLGQAGQTRLISLKLAKEKKPRTAVVREFDRDWRKGELVHVDFYQVKMEEKIKLEVPVVLVGEAPALKSKAHMLEHELGTLTVECLPAKIPTSLEVDISSLTEPEQAIRVKDIPLDKGITVLNDPELVVAKISLRPVEKVEEKVVEEVAEEAVEAPGEAAPGEEEEA
ncbi:MAG TPA: 50S ribosomal protein L25 [Dehalococcoidia bacterium]|nr:50S ribosomal protein L25 [Dehalococcoidia bacterium]